ncbi:hypothetical protein F8568_036770 [Actinomadura sp. LD22]|uniref:Uncharacterized protein n=1 Tax=Actinomadura physcomitrii TaxID=2650748 RepID=A0A6I4MU37_9ACTN|nr:hypothetical protein [Actinomadura physcomitrii]MWA05816.1 hypothetical protein [Actinomadura physcomitrii]
MITEDDIRRAELELAEAQDALAELGPGRRFAWLTGRESGAVRAARVGWVDQAAERLEALRAQYAAERADLADRPAREKAAGKVVADAGKALEASRKRVTDAAAAAQAAMVELLDAGAAHDELVQHTAAELVRCGLPLSDGSGVDHQTGGTRGAVRLRGAWWTGVEPSSLAVWVLHRVAVARLPRLHGLTRHLQHFGRRLELDARPDGLLDKVPALAAARVRELPRPEIGEVHGAPVVFADDYERGKAERQAREAVKVGRPVSLAEAEQEYQQNRRWRSG